jgi:hypothetical protein
LFAPQPTKATADGLSEPSRWHTAEVIAERVLAVPAGARPDVVKAAFARQVRAVHPDAGGDPDAAAERIRELIRARDQLLAGPSAAASGTPSPSPVTAYRRRRWTGWWRPRPSFRRDRSVS